MNKERIMNEMKSLVEWSLSLKNISNDLWFKPFREGSWGTADVISHFISWDRFMIENRISFILREESFPKINVNVEASNKEASNYAKSGISKEDLIDEFISVREELVSLIEKIQTEKFDLPFPGNENITLSEYFIGDIDHEFKHKEQIESHIRN
jgi:hypothetical protein